MTIPKLSDTETHLWDDKDGFLLLVHATNPARCATPEWFAEHRGELRAALDRYGAAFFRGFQVDSRQFEALMNEIAGDPLPYLGGVSPRTPVHGSVFTASDAPPTLDLVQHHELAYHSYTPRYVCLYCDTPSPSGGATPVTDARRFGRTMAAEAPAVMDTLEKKGTLFVRNYNEANFKSWSRTWHTDDRAELESMLRDAGMDWEWISDAWLRTRKRVPAIARDPSSGVRVLFSCINLWHRSFVVQMNRSVDIPLPEDPEMQPFATFYGDGTPIPDDFIDLMHRTHAEQMIAIPWQKCDFMVVQNFLATHGRQSYVPPRKTVVTLREKVHMTDPLFSQPEPLERRHG